MVRCAPHFKRPDAACCKVEVIKGALGRLVYPFSSTRRTSNFVEVKFSARAFASVSLK